MTVRRIMFVLVLAVLAIAFPEPAPAQTPPGLSDLAIEQLFDVELTSTASKFSQEVTRAPASVTVVTADEIRTRGYRSFAELLSGVRGIYTSYDRNYSYIGVRGFARPGDYNTRVLLLVDGHRINEPIYDMAPVGNDFPIDLAWVERVEVIRGPSSSLYGTSAFLAVINVITKTAAVHNGVRVKAATGSLSNHDATASMARVFDGGNELLVGVSGHRSGGNSSLYFPEFAALGMNDGVARDADREHSASAFVSASIGRYRIRGAFIDRTKRVPTGSFGTVFGDSRERTDDRWMFADIASQSAVAGWTATVRAALDVNAYRGVYPYDYGLDEPVVQDDGSDSAVASGELTLNRRWRGHVVTVGSEFRRQLHNHQWIDDLGERTLDEQHAGHTLGLYAQDEISLRPWLLLNAGARFDYNSAFGGHANPRVGLVFLPRQQSAIKLLYGQAYRAPNSYELYYFSPTMREVEAAGTLLGPETIETTELVWEEYVGSHLRTGVSLFHYDVKNLVEQRSLAGTTADEAATERLYFANATGHAHANGIEAEVEGRWRSGVTARATVSHVRANDRATDDRLSNSPQNLATFAVTLPVPVVGSTLTLDTRLVGDRRALDGSTVAGFVLGNVVTTTPLSKRFELGVGVYNALDRRYGDPGAEEHLQRAIEQDGRTFRVQLSTRF